MTITFADGTRLEVAAAAFNDFIKHDLKWVEFVHGRATVKKPADNQISVHTLKATGTTGKNGRCSQC
jgi:hypothetical protein